MNQEQNVENIEVKETEEVVATQEKVAEGLAKEVVEEGEQKELSQEEKCLLTSQLMKVVNININAMLVESVLTVYEKVSETGKDITVAEVESVVTDVIKRHQAVQQAAQQQVAQQNMKKV